ncbi:hypothetical protein PV05_11058 [Exophiala xenobiotica]|uniref:ENTH domain-containing protein n=1 Tax=Exophiala xenobiotica TaxID=348802 RepID=A0A0D2CHS2_9EURO|nr:uncharacterized protein PV05_11058 [Exophiala xenobiotica]KIW49377.1 hypothetical protein PV05_11058 [Exophiala xenobiotica]
MSKVVRSVKNVTKGYSSVQIKVRNATSNDPWGPTGTDMAEIAALTFNNPSDFYEIMDMLDKRLNDKGKNWRHVLKSLKVLDYCLHEGSELVVTWARKNIYIIKTLREFMYIDEDGKDVGQNVRTSAKELTSLILDEERLRSERSDRKLWKTRVHGIDEYAPQAISGPSGPSHRHGGRRSSQENDREQADLEEALRRSMMSEDAAMSRPTKQNDDETDPELRRAIQLSKEEADLRARQLEDANAASLFDDTPAPTQPQPTGYNQGYQQQPAVDWFGNPLQQQPQSTGYLNNQYAQPQQTGYQTGFPNGFQPSQPTGYDQFGQQPFLQQQNTIQPQQTAFQTNNPYGLQPSGDMFGAQSPQSQPTLQPGTNNPWATQSPQAAEPLMPLPTGSNNPFAQRTQQASPSPFQRTTTQPSLGTLFESQPTNQFNQPSQPNPITNYQPSPQPSFQQQQQKPTNPQHARLNALLASGEGQDTFGNTGDLRIPAQHTAPGTFVNSAGQGIDRLRAAQTGTNPFFSSQATGFGQQMPAQTGPASGYGGGFGQQNNNPFGARPVGQQSGSLIDL